MSIQYTQAIFSKSTRSTNYALIVSMKNTFDFDTIFCFSCVQGIAFCNTFLSYMQLQKRTYTQVSKLDGWMDYKQHTISTKNGTFSQNVLPRKQQKLKKTKAFVLEKRRHAMQYWARHYLKVLTVLLEV